MGYYEGVQMNNIKPADLTQLFYKEYKTIAPYFEETSDGCWKCLCHKSTCGIGYITIRLGKKVHLLHRIVYHLVYRDLLDSSMVMHSCDKPFCCNPAHLKQGTSSNNAQDRETKYRGTRALTVEQVREVRDSIATQISLGKKYGVNRRTIAKIQNRERYVDIP